MKNETKLKKLVAWLDENNIKYSLPTESFGDVKPDLVINVTESYRINVKVDNGNQDELATFYQNYKGYNPLFIRTEDTMSFVMEKAQNTIIKMMKKQFAREQRTPEHVARLKAKRHRKELRRIMRRTEQSNN